MSILFVGNPQLRIHASLGVVYDVRLRVKIGECFTGLRFVPTVLLGDYGDQHRHRLAECGKLLMLRGDLLLQAQACILLYGVEF